MRKLNTADVFAFCRVIKKSGMREDLKRIISRISATDDVESIGMDGMFAIVESLAENGAESAIYEFLSAPLEVTPSEVASMDMRDFFDAIKKIVEENDLPGFSNLPPSFSRRIDRHPLSEVRRQYSRLAG